MVVTIPTKLIPRPLSDAAKVRKYEAMFDGIVAYIEEAHENEILSPDIYAEIIERLYEAFDADPKTGKRAGG